MASGYSLPDDNMGKRKEAAKILKSKPWPKLLSTPRPPYQIAIGGYQNFSVDFF